MKRLLLLLLLFLNACASSPPSDDADPNAMPATWDFRFYDKQDALIGSLRLGLTNEPIDEGYCGEPYFMKAVVLRNELDLEFWEDLQPAWHIYAYWLSVDLTASSCNVNYVLLGNIDSESASGFFNFSHRLGGENIGRFEASPVRPD